MTRATPIYDDSGDPIKASFSVHRGKVGIDVILESRGGTLGTPSERNPEYSKGLRILVERLAVLGCTLEGAFVASMKLLIEGMSEEQRRVAGLDLPLTLGRDSRVEEIAWQLQRGQKRVGTAGDTSGGNTTRRLLLRVDAGDLGAEELAERLAVGPRQPDFPVPLGLVQADESSTGSDFDPQGLIDARNRVLAALTQRQGQLSFRRKLLSAYGARCAISGCQVAEVLEAAHITPYWGPKTNHVQNGILLRADLHTLFDRGVIGIDPDSWTVRIAERVVDSHYAAYRGSSFSLPKDRANWPSAEALKKHLHSVDLV